MLSVCNWRGDFCLVKHDIIPLDYLIMIFLNLVSIL